MIDSPIYPNKTRIRSRTLHPRTGAHQNQGSAGSCQIAVDNATQSAGSTFAAYFCRRHGEGPSLWRRQEGRMSNLFSSPLAWSQLEDDSATQGDRLANIVSEEFTRWLPPTSGRNHKSEHVTQLIIDKSSTRSRHMLLQTLSTVAGIAFMRTIFDSMRQGFQHGNQPLRLHLRAATTSCQIFGFSLLAASSATLNSKSS